MHSLYLRIFVLFWLAMALIVGGSIATTFTIALHEYEPQELQRRPAVAIQASEVLARGGVSALKVWLDANKYSMGDRDLFIVGPDGRDILGRHLPEGALRRLEFVNREAVRRTRAARLCASAARQFSSITRRAADRCRGWLHLYRSFGAAAPEYLRRAQFAGNLPDHTLHCAGGECANQLVAGGASDGPHSPYSSGRARTRLGESRCARQRGSRRTQGRTRGARARLRCHGGSAASESQRDHPAAARHLARTALTARPHACRTGAGAPAAGRLSAPVGSAGAGDRTPRLSDQPGFEARASAGHGCP